MAHTTKANARTFEAEATAMILDNEARMADAKAREYRRDGATYMHSVALAEASAYRHAAQIVRAQS